MHKETERSHLGCSPFCRSGPYYEGSSYPGKTNPFPVSNGGRIPADRLPRRLWGGSGGDGGASSSFGSITTPRPINPATGTTIRAHALQTLNPYLGSTPQGIATKGTLNLSLEDAIARGLRFNLGLIDSQQADADVRAQRARSLAALLPQISARAEQTYQQLSYKQLNIKLPPQGDSSCRPPAAISDTLRLASQRNPLS